MRNDWVRLAALLLPVLTGCMSHTRKLQQPRLAGAVLNAGAAQLVESINHRYERIQSLSATVEFFASVGGERKGKQTDYTSIRGYILFRKPRMLRVLGLVPVLHTRAFDLASDGQTFTLLIPPKNRALEGANSVSKPSAKTLENMRPGIFLDSILVDSIAPDKIVMLTSEQPVEEDKKTKQLIEKPQYDLTVLSAPPETGGAAAVRVAKPQRVIYISRSNLLPIGQDIYNGQGELETEVRYGPYQDFGGIEFPASITITRPLEEYRITLAVEKLRLNQTLADDQFELKVPPGTQVQKLQ